MSYQAGALFFSGDNISAYAKLDASTGANIGSVSKNVLAPGDTTCPWGDTTGQLFRSDAVFSLITALDTTTGAATHSFSKPALGGRPSLAFSNAESAVYYTISSLSIFYVMDTKGNVLRTISKPVAMLGGTEAMCMLGGGSPGGGLPTISVSAADASAAEPSDTGRFVFTRSGGDITKEFEFTSELGGSAQQTSDYNFKPIIWFGPGSTTAEVYVNPVNDAVHENAETVVVTIPPNAAYKVGTPASATITIADDDPATTVSIGVSDSTASESSGNTGTFTITRAGPSSASLPVSFTVGGSATQGTDYQSIGGTATIPAGQLSTTVVIRPIDDQIYEGNETAIITIKSGADYGVGTPASATVSIAENDPMPELTLTSRLKEGINGQRGVDVDELSLSNATIIQNGDLLNGMAVYDQNYELKAWTSVTLYSETVIKAGANCWIHIQPPASPALAN